MCSDSLVAQGGEGRCHLLVKRLRVLLAQVSVRHDPLMWVSVQEIHRLRLESGGNEEAPSLKLAVRVTKLAALLHT